jgi:transmembrane sensor
MFEPVTPSDSDRRAALEARDWIVRLTSGKVDAQDMARFKAWRDAAPAHRVAFERERDFWQELQVLERRAGVRRGAIPAAPLRDARLGRRAFLAGSGALAAATVGLLAAPRLEVWWNADLATAVGEQAEFSLPDGSTVLLNTDSALALDFQGGARRVALLRGEAEFRIAGASEGPFQVASLGGESETLSALFTVKELAGDTIVSVREGWVHVSGSRRSSDLAGAASVAVGANQQTRYAHGEWPRPAVPVDMDTVLAWRSGRLIFEGQSFGTAVAEIARYLPERVVVAPTVAQDIPVSAVVSTGEPLVALRTLAGTMGLSTSRVPGVLILLS